MFAHESSKLVLYHTKSIPQTGRAACEQFPYKSYGGESGRPKQQPPPTSNSGTPARWALRLSFRDLRHQLVSMTLQDRTAGLHGIPWAVLHTHGCAPDLLPSLPTSWTQVRFSMYFIVQGLKGGRPGCANPNLLSWWIGWFWRYLTVWHLNILHQCTRLRLDSRNRWLSGSSYL